MAVFFHDFRTMIMVSSVGLIVLTWLTMRAPRSERQLRKRSRNRRR